MQHIRFFLLVIVFISAFTGLDAANPPPANDTVCDAIDLGILPVPGLCPSYPYGDTVHVNGTTNFASYNTFDFSPAHCFPSGAPDVWYKFRGTGSFLYIEMYGYNDLDSFFVKLHDSQGSCLGLIPLNCQTTTNGFLQATFYTPEIGGEYYMQIGGSTFDETGDFMFFIKSYNECSSCVKNAEVSMSPAPWFGRYGTSDTVQMCTTVDRWDQTTSSYLHSITLVFGDEWDTATLVPTVLPGPAGSGWMWGENITTPAGVVTGFFYDGNFDGNPVNNPGENGNVNTSWTACWSISTKTYCNTYDALVEVNINSDNITSNNANTVAICQDAWHIDMGLSGWCCPDPIVTMGAVTNCASFANIVVDPVSVNASDTFNIVLYDDSLDVVAYSTGVTGTTTFSVAPGDYLIEVYNVSNTCISYHQLHVNGAFDIDFTQTTIGCGPGSGSVIATPNGGAAPFTYSWTGITTYNDSLAYNLDEGYAVVQVTDAMGCSVVDSMYVTVLPMPGADFGYADKTYCSNDDTIQVYFQPYTSGGTYTLVSPTGAGITVDPVTGTISLNNSPLTPPYYVYVKYQVGTSCVATFIDSVQMVQQPAAPTASSPQIVDWCISNAAPMLSINVSSGIPFWYDVQTTQSGFNYSVTPSSLNASTAPGQYLYGFVYLADFTGGCSSLPLVFTVNAAASPQFTMSPATTICAGDTAQLYVVGSGGYQYQWNPPPTTGPSNLPYTSTAPSSTTLYACTISDMGCSSVGYVNIVVDLCSDTGMTVYSGITPNNDGHNDTWIIDGAETRTNVTVTIYNRWGFEVWKGNNYNNTTVVWAGKDQSQNELPEGTYYYTITQDNSAPATGWIELSR